jgi:MFS transporter, PPP family, 3-phenylpropionic acid transporter
VLWAWSVGSEAIMFAVFNRAFSHRSPTALLAMAGVGAMVRWVVYPIIWPTGFGVAGFFAVQSLHSFSTALMLIGVQKLIVETVPEDRTGAAQGIAFFANGISMAAITLLSGPLYAAFGVNGFFPMVAIAAIGLALVGLAHRVQPRRDGLPSAP